MLFSRFSQVLDVQEAFLQKFYMHFLCRSPEL